MLDQSDFIFPSVLEGNHGMRAPSPQKSQHRSATSPILRGLWDLPPLRRLCSCTSCRASLEKSGYNHGFYPAKVKFSHLSNREFQHICANNLGLGLPSGGFDQTSSKKVPRVNRTTPSPRGLLQRNSFWSFCWNGRVQHHTLGVVIFGAAIQ